MSSPSSPGSLRELYSTPSAPWTFTPPSSSNTSSTLSPQPQPGPSYVFPASPSSSSHRPRSAGNSIFDLSPELADGVGVDVVLLAKAVVAGAVLQYATTAIAMPWEVGKLLLQVQWVPRDANEMPEAYEDEEPVPAEEELSDDSGEDAYFADPGAAGPSASLLSTSTTTRAVRPVDERGYVVRRSVMEEGTRPEFVIPVGSAGGVWDMIKRVGRFRPEGWLALFKGLLTSCIQDVLSSTIQPLIHSALLAAFKPPSLHAVAFTFPPYAGALALPVASHLLTGFLLSPLDLVRTRLIAQSFSDRHATYRGPLDALKQIYAHEGGLAGMYLHPHLFIPTVIDNALRPLLALGLPPLLARRFSSRAFDPSTNPIAWAALDLLCSALGIALTLPFETVRRRLQVQTRGRARPLRACVEVRPVPYNGVVDALWHIITEERSDLPIRPRRKRKAAVHDGKGKKKEGKGRVVVEEDEEEDMPESRWRRTGLGQLYRGLGMRLAASVVVFVAGLTMGDGDADAGWAEL